MLPRPKHESMIELLALSMIVLSFIRPSIQLFCAPLPSFYCETRLPSIRCRAAYLASIVVSLLSALAVLEAAKNISSELYIGVGLAIIVIFGAAACLGIVALFSAFFKELLLFRSPKPVIKLACYSVLFGVGAVVIVRWQEWTGFYTGVIVAVLCLPTLFFLSGLYRFRSTKSFLDQAPASHVSSPPEHFQRLVWIVFDELDQRLAFDCRPSHLALPSFDRLFGRSLVCTAAYPPSRCTEISIPALLTGQLIRETVPYGNGNLALHYLGSEIPEPFQSQSTIFHKIHDRQLNAGAIVGYHPLPRVLGKKLVDCLFTAAPTQVNVLDVGFGSSMCRCFRSLFETPSYSLFGTSLVARAAAERYVTVMTKAEEMAGNPDIDFAFIHLPIPHAPYIFDRASGIFGPQRTKPARYLDNLALADQALDRVMNAIAKCPVNTAVIVTSDHWWRHSPGYDGMIDRRVPLAIHFSGQKTGCEYKREINTASLHDLVLGIVDKTVTTPDEAAGWLRSNAYKAPPTKL